MEVPVSHPQLPLHQSTLLSIPPEVQLHELTKFMDCFDIYQLSLTCKEMNARLKSRRERTSTLLLKAVEGPLTALQFNLSQMIPG